jgi:hypothetical protein
MELNKSSLKELIQEEISLVEDMDKAIASPEILPQDALQIFANRVGNLFQRLDELDEYLNLKWSRILGAE